MAVMVVLVSASDQPENKSEKPPENKTTVAVYPIKITGDDKSLGPVLTSFLVTKLSQSSKLGVIEEEMNEEVERQLAYANSDKCDATQCKIEIGKAIPAQKLLIGTVAKLGQKYLMNVRVIDIQQKVVDFSVEDSRICQPEDLDQLVGNIALKIRAKFGEDVEFQETAPAQSAGASEAGGQTGRGWLGVRLQNLTPDKAKSLGLNEAKGAEVQEVINGSPAAKADLKLNDVMTELDGNPISDATQLIQIISSHGPGATVTLQVWRAGKYLDKQATLAKFPIATSLTTSAGLDKLVETYGPVPIPLNGKWGYLDKTGKFYIKPQFDHAWLFSEGLAPVQMGDKYGFIDQSGNFVIKPQFEALFKFEGGLAAVKLGGKWGFIDPTGKFAINPQFDALSFAIDEGLPNYFQEGMVAAEIGGKWGYIDKTGKFAINPKFSFAGYFSEGLANVQEQPLAANEKGKRGYIDKTGKYIIKPKFDSEGIFSDGLAPVGVMVAGKPLGGYIEKSGGYAIRPQFDYADNFHEELAAVRVGAKFGYIDKNGKYEINPQFDYAYQFNEGLGLVKIGEVWGYVDKTGRYVINPQFDEAGVFVKGFAWVQVGITKSGWIDKSGNYVVVSQ